MREYWDDYRLGDHLFCEDTFDDKHLLLCKIVAIIFDA